jgi:ATP-dependent DNA helicase RecG
MMKYSRAYGGADPELIEGDVFKIIISVLDFGEKPETASPKAPVEVPVTNSIFMWFVWFVVKNRL